MTWSGNDPTCEREGFSVCISAITDSRSPTSQLLTVELSLTQLMEWWTHPLELPSITQPPTPVPQLPTPLSVMLPGPVNLMECGAPLLPLVQVSWSASLDWQVTLTMLKEILSACIIISYSYLS